MPVKNILAAYSGFTRSGGPLRHAIRIAEHNDAWITGVVSHGSSSIERQYGGQLTSALRRQLRALDTERVAEIKDRFNRVIAERGRSARADFVDLEEAGFSDVAAFARLFDLVVMGNPSSIPTDTHLTANPDVIALQSGRPVLIVPEEFRSKSLSKHALIAWDGKRSAARAVGDAIPVLQEKPRVTVLTIGKSVLPGTDRLMTNFQRHGIRAELELRPRRKGIGRTILQAVEEISAELIVMGAFEHSKFAHDLMGGVTTDVMRMAKVPVFMSH